MAARFMDTMAARALRAVAAAWLAACGMAGAQTPFRTMIIHPVAPYEYHKTDYDFALARAGIESRHYAATDTDAVMADIDKYDMVMCTPLVNLNEVFAGQTETVRAWIGKGNALIVADACYENLYNPWLAELVPAELHCAPCYGAETVTNRFVVDTSPAHPLRCFPERLDYESRQWLCLKADSAWETVATCSGPSQIHPVTVMYPIGKGVVYVSSMQQRWQALPKNMRPNLLLRRLGYAPAAFGMSPTASGPGRLALALKSLGKEAKPLKFRLAVAADAAGARKFGPREPVFMPDAQGNLMVRLDYTIGSITQAQMVVEVCTPGTNWITLFERIMEVPPPYAVMPPRYRGVLSTRRRTPEVAFEVRSAGGTPGALVKSARVSVHSPAQALLGSATATLPQPAASAFIKVRLPGLTAGDGYVVKAMIRSADGRTAQVSSKFTVRAPDGHAGDTIVDEDGTLLVDGEPFFPLGLYHLYPDAYTEAAELGFNTVQTFQWMTRRRESLDAAQALGLKVVFEKNDKTLHPHRMWPAHIRDHPALLMWYAPDEPLHEPDHYFAMDVYRIYRDNDPWHPVLRVNFNPPRFGLDVLGCDLLAPYNYCLDKDKSFADQPYWKIAHTLEAGRMAGGKVGGRPLFAVQQVFGHEEPEAVRICAWLALTKDVRGFLWYAWDERHDNVGLSYAPELREGMRGLLAQFRELTPALVAPVRRTFVDGKVHGMVCTDPASRDLTLILVNLGDPAPVPQIQELRDVRLEPMFGAPAADKNLEHLECRAYRKRH